MINLLLVSSITFPHGMADTNRVTQLCNGFIGNQLDVELLVGRDNGFDLNDYHFKVHSVEKSDINIRKRSLFSLIYSRLNFIFCFCGLIFKKKYKTIYFYHPNFDNLVIIILTKLFTKSKIVIEYTDILEVPQYFSMVYLLQRFSYVFSPYFADTVVVISLRLKRYFSLFYKIQAEYIPALRPIQTKSKDIHKFSHIKKKEKIVNMLFAGSLIESEGVDDLIRAFGVIVQNRDHLFLNIIGFSLARDSSTILSLINSLGLQDFVKFHGYKTQIELNKFIENADILVIPKKNTKYNRFGFSTKLPEYIFTNKIVVCSDISDFHLYTHGLRSLVLFKPNSIDDLITVIETVLTNLKYYKQFLPLDSKHDDLFNPIFHTKELSIKFKS